MRKIYYIAIFMILATMVSCQKDEELLNVQNIVKKTFYATFDDGNTRTALDSSNNVIWSENDQISVFGGTTANNSFKLNEGAGTTLGKFVVNSAVAATESNSSTSALSANVAYYPYDNNVTISESNGTYTLNATFPDTQTYSTSGTFGNGASPMVAVTSNALDANLKFKNVGAVFRLQLKGDATITKIVFSADAFLAGECEITASNTAVPTTNVTNGSNTITLNCGEGVALNNSTPTNFIVAMLPVENVTGGMTIDIFDNAGMKMVYTYKESEPITIERSKAYSTAEVTYNGDHAVTAVGAQGALDNAKSGTTIQLEPNVHYGTLVFRKNADSRVVDITDAGGDAVGNEHFSKYENITILGAPGAVVDQIDFQAGWIAGSGANYIEIKNLRLDGITFSGEKIAVNLEGSKGSALGIDGLTLENCKMNDANSTDRLVFQQISGYKQLVDKTTSEYVMTTGIKDLTINNCEVTGAYMVIESRAMENLTITNNTFKNIAERDMLITSDATNHPNATYTGTITITGNTSTGGKERFIRASLNNSNATVIIRDNTITNYLGADPDWIKVSGYAGTMDIENNTFAVSHNNENYLQKLVLNAMDGTVFKLGAGDYGSLDFTYTYNGSKIKAKNITIQGAGVLATTMSNLISPEGGNHVINWKITDIKFNNQGIDVRSGGNNLTIENCQFSNGANIYISNDYDNIIVKKCDFNTSVTGGVYFQKVRNIDVQQCTFTDMPYNAIQLSGEGVAGNVSITNNTISNCVSRAMRIVTMTDASLNISNNTMTNSNNATDDTEADRGQVIKITGSVVTGTFENNTHNGSAITFTNGIAR